MTLSTNVISDCLSEVVDYYHNVAAPWRFTQWMGHQLSKCPIDLWTYQEIIWETEPDLIIETGTGGGGSALFFASMLDMIGGEGDVVTIDEHTYPNLPTHQRIRYLVGDSLGDALHRHLTNYHQPLGSRTVMVVLDSLHTYEHVAKELDLYGPSVSVGCYLVVEDTVVDYSSGAFPGPAARQAARDFVMANKGFEIDKSREKHLLTLNPDGWIKRVA